MSLRSLLVACRQRLGAGLLPALPMLFAGVAQAQIRVVLPPPPLPPDELVALTSGNNHNCVSRRDGMVLCWGSDASGESGVAKPDECGTKAISRPCVLVPTRLAVDVNGAAFASTRVSAGWNHTCALDSLGAAFCWGLNADVQTGVVNWNGFNYAIPAQVWLPTPTAAGQRFTAISAGNRTTCALDASATWCWGLLNSGTPGTPTLNGDTVFARLLRSASPQAIQPASGNFQALSVGFMHLCLQTNLTGFTEIDCIGRNDFGELGYAPSIGPAFVIFGSAFGRPVGPPSSRGTFTCADRLSDGTVACAGQNNVGMLGNGNYVDSGTPQVVGGGAKLSGVAAGWRHACAIDPLQQAWCWGDNGSGQLGNGSTIGSNRPVLVGGGTVKFRLLSAGYAHTCGIATDNKVYCWGSNGEGQLGRGYVGSFDWGPRTAAGPFRM